jgi:hypothetical protein
MKQKKLVTKREKRAHVAPLSNDVTFDRIK